MLIQFIRSYPPYRRPFLYPQPEDVPFRGDRDPLHGKIRVFTRKIKKSVPRRLILGNSVPIFELVESNATLIGRKCGYKTDV